MTGKQANKLLPLSVCLIARDEAATLPRCLDSVADLASEIIVVDTGSTDETPRIAQRYGARVIPIPWQDHFGEARNSAVTAATQPWTLVLDADDWLPEPSRQRLLASLEALNDKQMVVGRLVALDMEEQASGVVLWPTAARLRFRGRVYEGLEGMGALEPVYWPDFTVLSQRLTWSPEHAEVRQHYYADLIAKEIADDMPRCEVLLKEGLNRLRADQRDEGMQLLHRLVARPDAQPTLMALATYAIANTHANDDTAQVAGARQQALAWVDRLLTHYPSHLDGRVLAAELAGRQEDWEAADEHLAWALQLYRENRRPSQPLSWRWSTPMAQGTYTPEMLLPGMIKILEGLGDHEGAWVCREALAGTDILRHLLDELSRRWRAAGIGAAWPWYRRFFAPGARRHIDTADPAAVVVAEAEVWLFLKQRGLAEAEDLPLLEGAVRDFPADPRIARLLSQCYVQAKRWHEAFVWGRTAMAQGDCSGELAINMGQIAFKLGRLDEAQAAFKQAKQDPRTKAAAEDRLARLAAMADQSVTARDGKASPEA